jgi:glycosyltransferase involved in cell wall biosynthesis
VNLLIRLPKTVISRTARIAMIYADALIEAGHRVRIATADEPVTWRSSSAEWVYVEDLNAVVPRDEETVIEAERLAAAPVVEDAIFRDATPPPHEPLRVLLAGAAEIESHGIQTGYGAIAHARWFHQPLDLIRVSAWRPSRDEPLDAVQEFHVALNTAEMKRLLHHCDVALIPSETEEGFSLVAAEAMAAGTPCVMTSTTANRSIDERVDYALFAPERNAVELGERLMELAAGDDVRERIVARGRELASRWTTEAAISRLLRELQNSSATS